MGSDARALHPRVLIWRHRLAGQLTTQPGCDLGQDDATTHVACSHCRRYSTAATADDEYVAGELHSPMLPCGDLPVSRGGGVAEIGDVTEAPALEQSKPGNLESIRKQPPAATLYDGIDKQSVFVY
jgi:hypothetical protein